MQKIVLEENMGTTVERAAEQAKKINNTINYLINKENTIMITQDSKVKNERILCLNVNYDPNNAT